MISLRTLVMVSLVPLTLSADPLTSLQHQFEAHTGAKLVFSRATLPAGAWFDRTPSLSAARQVEAARILVREAKKYPAGYLRAMGLKTFGVFHACVSNEGDGFRPYNEELRGYRYFGMWNGSDAAIGAYYSAGQLPLTFHHEVFHHVDATTAGVTTRHHFTADDARFREAVTLKRRYDRPRFTAATLRALDRCSSGAVLHHAVSDYSEKAAGEDQAETARYVMSHLPDALVQVVRRPELRGSQRIMHVLREYGQAVEKGPAIDWFVRTALRECQAR